MESWPLDILNLLVVQLSARDVLRLERTSKGMRDRFRSNMLWKSMYHRDISTIHVPSQYREGYRIAIISMKGKSIADKLIVIVSNGYEQVLYRMNIQEIWRRSWMNTVWNIALM